MNPQFFTMSIGSFSGKRQMEAIPTTPLPGGTRQSKPVSGQTLPDSQSQRTKFKDVHHQIVCNKTIVISSVRIEN